MRIMDTLKEQFIDVVEYIDEDGKTIVNKYVRLYANNNEIKTGAKVIVRPSQIAVFFKGGQFADILKEGTHKITTNNLPILSKLMAFPFLFNSPLKADLYFISLKQFVGNKWSTKNPLIVRDKEFKVIRIKSFGTFSFKIENAEVFVREVLGTQRRFETKDILEYLVSYIVEAFSVILGEIDVPIIDLATQYSKLSNLIQLKANIKAKEIGIKFSNINVENISLPEQVEKLIDEQSGIGMASQDMKGFIQYQSARAIREVANQSGGIAGLGASAIIGKQIAKTMSNDIDTTEIKIKCNSCGFLNDENVKFCSECGKSLVNKKDDDEKKDDVFEQLRQYKLLLDDGTLTVEEYNIIKNKLLNS